MNTANLQLEGILLALSAICRDLKRNGALSDADLAEALASAERGVGERASNLSDANAEAVLFPIRFLRYALQNEQSALDFAAIASAIGRERDARLPSE